MHILLKLRLILVVGCCCLIYDFNLYAQSADHTEENKVTSEPVFDTSGAQVLVADVVIEGDTKTKSYIIQREVPFKKGQQVSRSEIPRLVVLARQQLMNTSLFVEVDVKPVFVTGDILLINIHVKERWYVFPIPYFKMIDRNFNSWWVEHKRSLQRINYGLKFSHNNVSGRNDKLNLWLLSGYTQQASIRYENPFLDRDLKHGMDVGFSYSRNREINYATNFNKQSFFKNEEAFQVKNIHIDLAYSYRPAVKTRHYFRVSYNDLQVSDTIVKLNPLYFPVNTTRVRFPDFSYNIQYFNVDYIPYPLKGFMGDAQFYKRFGKKDNVWQVGGKGTFTKKIFPNSYLQFQASGMVRLPFNQPYYNTRLFGNSDLYMRGMEYYVIDGVAGGVVRATAIQKAFQFNLPMPVKIKTIPKVPVKVYVKGFGDAGYSYNPRPGNSMLNNKFLKSWGIGIDVVTIYDIVLKFEYSFNQLGDKGLYIHSKSDW